MTQFRLLSSMSKRKQSTLDSAFFHSHARKAPRLDDRKKLPNGNSSRYTSNADHPPLPPSLPQSTSNLSARPHIIHPSISSNTPKHISIIKAAAQPASKTPSPPIHPSHHVNIITQPGNLFTAPKSSLLIHACNTRGTWGAGIAATFKLHYPAAFKVYNSHCITPSSSSSASTASKSKTIAGLGKQLATSPSLLGTTLLIPPQTQSSRKSEREACHFIACLYTSKNVGMNKDSPAEILAATESAVRDLLGQVRAWKAESTGQKKGKERIGMGEMVMCKINSGLFGVPWESTKAVLEGIEVEGREDVVITVMEKD